MSLTAPGAPSLPGSLTLPPPPLSDHGSFCNDVILRIKLHPAVISQGAPPASCDQAGSARDTDAPPGIGCGANPTPPIGSSARAHLNPLLKFTALPPPKATLWGSPCFPQQQPQGQQWNSTQSFQNLTGCQTWAQCS